MFLKNFHKSSTFIIDFQLIADKIGITSKIDYYSSDFIVDIFSKEINDKIKQIAIGSLSVYS